MQETLVLALGGNALIIDPQHQTLPDQYEACHRACLYLAGLLEDGYKLLLTHGNGPQVGFISRRSELSRKELHPVPLDVCVADTQGAIGAMLQRSLTNHTKGWANPPTIATIVTQVLVDRDDPAFLAPSKPIGAFMDEATARTRERDEGWSVMEDAKRGYRRVVPSPAPQQILEVSVIEHLLKAGFVVIAAGGGGIPVIERADGQIDGVEAVIDKDHTSCLLARHIEADKLVIATDIEQVMLHYKTPEQKALSRVTLAEAKAYFDEGHFGTGSMGPKVLAAIHFVESTGREAIITHVYRVRDALKGITGTRFVP